MREKEVKMRYYAVSDVHGFYSLMISALKEAGYFEDTQPHKLIIAGDYFDRGKEAVEMQKFLLEGIRNDEIILIKGNHEDLFEQFVEEDQGLPYPHHVSNGTYDTALQLTGRTEEFARTRREYFTLAAMETPYYQEIIPAARDYFETENYVFVHGWIPAYRYNRKFAPMHNWRNAAPDKWAEARWYNGMDAYVNETEPKTIVCGHWHCSYGHAKYEGICAEFDKDSDFTPFYDTNIIAIDACTAFSGRVNCIVIDDEPIE